MTAAKQFVEGGPVPQGKVDRNAALAVRIATQLGLPVEPLETLRAGSVNHTFVVGHDAERCVIRFAVDPFRVDEFVTEAWCLRLAAATGSPVLPWLRSGPSKESRQRCTASFRVWHRMRRAADTSGRPGPVRPDHPRAPDL